LHFGQCSSCKKRNKIGSAERVIKTEHGLPLLYPDIDCHVCLDPLGEDRNMLDYMREDRGNAKGYGGFIISECHPTKRCRCQADWKNSRKLMVGASCCIIFKEIWETPMS
jgi:hypothetical protein